MVGQTCWCFLEAGWISMLCYRRSSGGSNCGLHGQDRRSRFARRLRARTPHPRRTYRGCRRPGRRDPSGHCGNARDPGRVPPITQSERERGCHGKGYGLRHSAKIDEFLARSPSAVR